MLTDLIWTLLAVQMALGAFDILYHHELTERLAWRASQKTELRLHGVRNLAYGGIFAVLGFVEPHGLWAYLLLAVMAAEIVVTLVDFVEEDKSRRLPASERVAHALLALNYGGLLALIAPVLGRLGAQPSEALFAPQGLWAIPAAFAAAGCVLFGARDLAAAARSVRLAGPDPARLALGLPGRQRILVTGATGFIGRRLIQALLAAGHEVIALVRDPRKLTFEGPVTLVTSLDQIGDNVRLHAVVNLAGEPISNGFWTLAKRREILRSRLRITREVRRLIARLHLRPAVLISGSAIGWYGLRDDEALTEASLPRACFSHRLCHAWEQGALKTRGLGVRVVTLRIGLVLGVDDGMLSRLLVPFEFGLGGRIGSGRQWMSWIERDDLVRLIVHAIGHDSLRGPVNAVAPTPVRNADFARQLGRALGRPAVLPAPGRLLRLALGDFADELLLNGQRVLPERALASGFRFRHEGLSETLRCLTGARPRWVNSSSAGRARVLRYSSGSSAR